MHRTQLMLEEWQYEALRARAESAGVSLAELVRRAISAYLQPEMAAMPAAHPLAAMEGAFADGSDARDHDAHLYGPRRP